MNFGNFAQNETVHIKFTTCSLSGVPTTLAGSPVVSVYRDSDTTQTTTGVSLTVDFDAVTGLNHVQITTTDAFYTTATEFQVVITAGTVGGNSVVGTVLGFFSIQNRYVALTASAVASEILTTPANKLVTDGSGRVTVGTNADKTGYSLTQAFPTNFSAMVISAGGIVDSNVAKVDGDTTAAANLKLTYNGTGYEFTNCGFPGLSTVPLTLTGGTSTSVTVGVFVGWSDDHLFIGSKVVFSTADGLHIFVGRVTAFNGTTGTFTTWCPSGASGAWPVTPQAGDTVSFSVDIPVRLDGVTHTGATIPAVTDLTTKTGFSLTQSFPSNFSSLAISGAGKVTVGTNDDKTGYSLTQSFPSNFSLLSINGSGQVAASNAPSAATIAAEILTTPANKLATDGTGRVTVGTNADKAGYSLSQSFPANFASLAITGGGAVTVGTNSDKTGYSLSQSFPTNFALLSIDGSGLVTATNGAPSAATIAAEILVTPANKLATDGSGRVTVGSNADKTGYSLTQAFPSNFASLAITGGGAVTVGTNSDKTGYSLSQSFPTNFALLSISGSGLVTATNTSPSAATIAAEILATPANKLVTDGSGRVTVGSNADKAGYSLTQSFPSNFASMAITAGGAVTVGTNNDKTGYSLTQSFPTNFALLAINGSGFVTATNSIPSAATIAAEILATPSNKLITDGSGRVTVGSNADKTGYSLTQSFPANFASLVISAGGVVDSNIEQIDADATAATNMKYAYNGTGYDFANCGSPGLSTVPYTIDSATSTSVTINLFSGWADNHLFVGSKIVFINAAGSHIFIGRITAFNGTTGTFTTYCPVGAAGAWPVTPQAGDTVTIVIDAPVRLDAVTHSGAVIPTVTDVTTKTGYSLSQSFPANFASLAITGGGAITVGTNNDKTGYSLTQSFPANFSSLVISGAGKVTVGTNDDKAGYSLTQTFPTNFSALAITAGGGVTATTVSDKTGYSLTQSFPANFASLAINGSGFVTATNASGATASEVAAAILVTPANKLATDGTGRVTVGTNSDKTGYSLTQSFPTNFASLAITGGGAVTVGTNSDKTGYSLLQAFPTNFATMVINGSGFVTASNTIPSAATIAAEILTTPANKLVTDSSGRVTVGTNADKSGYSLTQAFPANFSSLVISGAGKVTVGTNDDKTNYSLSQSFPSNFSLLSINGSGQVASSNMLTASSVASAILSNSANRLVTDNLGRVTATNGGGGGGGDPAEIAAAILADPANKIVTDAQGRVVTQPITFSQTFPTNFDKLEINSRGHITVGVNTDKTGYSIADGVPPNFSLLKINDLGRVTAERIVVAVVPEEEGPPTESGEPVETPVVVADVPNIPVFTPDPIPAINLSVALGIQNQGEGNGFSTGS